MCVKPAALTTHSPLKISARPRTAQALPEHFRSPTQCRRTPAGCAMHSPPTAQPIPRRRPPLAPAQRHALPEYFRSPTQPRRTPAGCAMHSPPTSQPIPPPKTFARPRTATRPRRALPLPHATPTHAHAVPNRARRLREAFPAEALRSSPHSDTPSPNTSAPPRSPDARPPTARCIPRRSPSLTPRSATLPPLPFRFGHKKTAPHSACAMPNVSVDRRCGRSFGLVSRALFAAVAGRWRVGVGLRPQPWALRSRRCGHVLRA